MGARVVQAGAGVATGAGVASCAAASAFSRTSAARASSSDRRRARAAPRGRATIDDLAIAPVLFDASQEVVEDAQIASRLLRVGHVRTLLEHHPFVAGDPAVDDLGL